MKRTALLALSLSAIPLLSGCCFPGYNWMNPWGCQTGQCAPGGYGAYGAPPQGYNMGYDYSTASYPVYSTMAAQPVISQPVIATQPAPGYPTIAVDSLPTYR